MENKLTQLMKNKKNGAAAAVPSSPMPPNERPALAFAAGGAFADTATPPATGNKLLAKMRAGGAPAATTPTPAPAGATTAPGQINPPEHQLPPAAAALPATVAAAGAELAASLEQGGEPVAAAARGRGRPSKAVVPPTGLAVKIKTLFINCGPVGVSNVVDAGQLIILAKKRILDATGLADYRFAEFGAGPGMLAVAVVAELDALEGEVSAVRLDTTTPEGMTIMVELMARAGLVVR